MQFSKISKSLSLAALASTAAAFSADSKDNVAVYWGQASAGSQEDLSYYCDSDDVDIVILSFLSSFPGTNDVPTLELSSACSDKYSNGLLKCPDIGTDIKSCQSKGKKVLLSLGGAAGTYGFTGDSEGKEFADTLWNLFGEGDSDTRPFGDAAVDGFDFDIENQNQKGYTALAKELRSKFSTSSKDYYLSAAPQCVYPDASVGDLLKNADIDFAFVQFYNNYCSLDKQFNWDTWADYAKNTSPNKDIKLYIGLPGASSAAGSGYVDISTIKDTLSSVGSNANFGGIMLWDASQSFTNKVNGGTFAHAVKDALSSLGGSSDDSKSSTTKASSSSTSTTAAASSSSTVNRAGSSSDAQASTSAAPVSPAPVTSAQAQISATTQSTQALVPTSDAQGKFPAQAPSSAAQSSEQTPASSAPAQQVSSIPAQQVSSAPASSAPTQVSSEQAPVSSVPAQVSSAPAQQVSSDPTQEVSSAPAQQVSSAPAQEASSAPVSSAPAQEASSTLSYPEVTSNTFSSAPSSFTSILTSSQTQQESSAPASSSAPTGGASASSVPDECSSSTGLSKAQCLNKSYKAGQFDGKPTDCEHGTIACSADGEYAVCNWGQWVTSACSSGTSCFAYNQGDSVLVGCNFESQESQFTKRSEHVHHDHI